MEPEVSIKQAPARELPAHLWSAGLTILTLLGALMRIWRVGSWPFYGDEATTVVASTDLFSWGDLRPLAFAFNHYLAVPLFGPTEFAFRLAPLITGIVVIPLGALAMRRYYGDRAGLLTGLLIALSPALLFHSQFGRYYMQAFLFSGGLLYALRRWSDTQRIVWLVAALLWFFLGWFTVQSTSFVLPGFALWALCFPRASGLSDLLSRVRRQPVLAGLGVIASLALAWALMARMQHASNDRLLSDTRYFSATQLVLAFVSSITLPVALAMAAGPFLALKDDTSDRANRFFLPTVAIGMLLTFAAAFPFLAVGPPHILSAGAVLFGLAGYTLSRIWRDSSPHWAGLAMALIIVASTAREVASHFMDGSRTDFRPAIEVVRSGRGSDAELVFATQHLVTGLYAPELNARELMPIPDSLAWLRDPARSAPAWLIVAEHRRGPDVPEELYGVHEPTPLCRQVFRRVPARLDYPVNAVRVYQCAPSALGSQ